MDKDVRQFMIIVAVTIAITTIIVYLISRARATYYIIYADAQSIKTSNGKVYYWRDLKNIHYMNKYIMGKGIETANYGLLFRFANGKAEINRLSNIYKQVFHFAETLKTPRTSVITKGLIRQGN